MRSAVVLALTAATAVGAQDANYTSSLDMNVTASSLRDPLVVAQWCRGQYDTCQTLCGGNTNNNDCVDESLYYNCKCASNNSAPGLQYYTQTMPTFICEELYAQCIQQHVGDQRGQDSCKKDIKSLCATQDPPKKPVTDGSDSSSSSSSSASPSSTPAPDSNGNNGGEESGDNVSTTVSDGFAAPTLAAAANGVAAIAAMGVFAYIL